MPALNTLASKTYGGKTYDSLVHIVHIYVVEAHPKSPDPSPYSGKVWEAKYSTKQNYKTYSGRVQNAKDMKVYLKGNVLLLVDDLTPGTYNNPVWCTYGTCPNCSFLIGKDGKLVEVLTKSSSSVNTLEAAMQKLVK